MPEYAELCHSRSAAMRATLFALILFPTATFAQDAAPAKRPIFGGKAIAQAKPATPAACKFVGTVKGTKLWAGDCVGLELRSTVPAEDNTSRPLLDQAAGALPKGQQ